MRGRLLERGVHMAQIVWRDLIHVVVEPVSKEQIAVAAPGGARRFGRIVIREIVIRHARCQTCFNIAKVFAGKGQGVVFRMTCNKRDALVFTGEQVGVALFRFGQNIKIGVVTNKRCREIGLA